MAKLTIKRKLAAVSRETQENTRSGQSKNTLNPGMAEEYIAKISEDNVRRVTEKLPKQFCRKESRILCALSNLDEILLNPLVRTCSVAVPGTSRNTTQKNGNPLRIVA